MARNAVRMSGFQVSRRVRRHDASKDHAMSGDADDDDETWDSDEELRRLLADPKKYRKVYRKAMKAFRKAKKRTRSQR